MTDVVRQFESAIHRETQQEVACPACDARESALAFIGRDRLFGRPGEYPLVRCSECGLLYVNPRPTPDALGPHYPDDYFAYALPTDVPAWLGGILDWLTKGISLKRLAYIEKTTGKLGPDSVVVDVGCGINSLLYWIRELRGAEGIGVDFSADVAAWVKRELDMRVEVGTLADVGLDAESIDVVTMTEYLEHEPDPRGVLEEARRVLKPDGYVAIEIPDPSGWPARLFKSAWWNLDVPRHLVFFDPVTLERTLARAGFEVVRIDRFGLPFYVGQSIYQAIGLPYSPKLHGVFLAVSTFFGAPFLPLTPWTPEFLFAMARPKPK